MASITIKGVDKLLRKFNSLQQIHDILRPPMQRSVMILQADLAKYPAPRSNSSYVWTGTLGRSWTPRVRPEGNRLVGRVGTKVIYAPFVQSDKFQARIHRRRWQTDVQVLERNRTRIMRQFESAIERALEA
jgi:hypothetical protein